MTIKIELQQEWVNLHASYDRYEWTGLLIKMTSIVLFFVALFSPLQSSMVVIILAVMWLQEAIWKTFQSRTEQRLLNIEAELSKPSDAEPFQFYTQWLASRPSTLGLIGEYAKHIVRPTIAYPYSVLIALTLFQRFF